MKIPEKIRIGGVDYKITETENLNNGERMLYGEIDFEQSTIKLAPQNQDHQHKSITLWHEILHGIIKNAGLDIKNEEQIVDALSKGVYMVLQDNGAALFDIVTEAEYQTLVETNRRLVVENARLKELDIKRDGN
jgi:hypothetical protein